MVYSNITIEQLILAIQIYIVYLFVTGNLLIWL